MFNVLFISLIEKLMTECFRAKFMGQYGDNRWVRKLQENIINKNLTNNKRFILLTELFIRFFFFIINWQ